MPGMLEEERPVPVDPAGLARFGFRIVLDVGLARPGFLRSPLFTSARFTGALRIDWCAKRGTDVAVLGATRVIARGTMRWAPRVT